MATKKQLKKDFSKEAMYRKIMPSITAPPDPFEEAPPIPETEVPEHEPYNVMELIVRSKLPSTMETLGACACDQCKSDVIAIALNHLPAAYTVGEAEHIRKKAAVLRAGNEIKITAAIIRAVQTVMAEPRHYSGDRKL